MGRRDTREKRCERCRINMKWCFCDVLVPTHYETPVTMLVHHREKWLTSNTAHFANLCLSNSRLLMRGLPDDDISYEQLISGDREPIFLFPDDDAIELDDSFPHANYHLIVPDGTWRQAKKFKRRIPEFKNIKTVKLPVGRPSRYLLRRQGHEEGLSTFEAIARALGFIEKEPKVEKHLDDIFKVIVKNTMMSRFGLPLGREELYPKLLQQYLLDSSSKTKVKNTL